MQIAVSYAIIIIVYRFTISNRVSKIYKLSFLCRKYYSYSRLSTCYADYKNLGFHVSKMLRKSLCDACDPCDLVRSRMIVMLKRLRPTRTGGRRPSPLLRNVHNIVILSLADCLEQWCSTRSRESICNFVHEHFVRNSMKRKRNRHLNRY